MHTPGRGSGVKICPICSREFDDADLERCPDDGTMLHDSSPELGLIGRLIDDRYEIKELIGQGGMGVVYKAFQRAVGRDIAMKFLRRAFTEDFVALRRFYKEARAASSLRHPNTITVFDFGQTSDGLLYYTMELLGGESLADALDRETRLNPVRAIRIAVQVCDSLAEAHEKGVVHRDLKPENIQIEQRHGHPDFVKVLDFGIAQTAQAEGEKRLTKSGMVCGTAAYMSPEGAQGKPVDARSDVYSLGVVLFEMLSGRLPFQGRNTMEVMMAHVGCRPPRLNELGVVVPQTLENLVGSMLAKRPEGRPESVPVLREFLGAVLAEIESPSSLSTPQVGDRLQATEESDSVPVAAPLPAAGEEDDDDPDTDTLPFSATELDSSSVERAGVPGRGRRRLPWIAAGIAAMVTIAALSLAFPNATETERGEPAPSPKTTAVDAPAAVEDPKPAATPEVVVAPAPSAPRIDRAAEVGLRRGRVAADVPAPFVIRVVGAPATVFEGSEELGWTPWTGWLHGPGPRALELVRKGSQTTPVELRGGTGLERIVTLAARRRPAVPRTAPKLKRF